MRASLIARALNRAVLMALITPALTPLAAPFILSCGDESRGSCAPTAYVPVDGGGGSGQCILDPYPCGAPLPAGCIGTYDLVRSSTNCDPQDGGAISQSLCEQVCPNWYGGPRSCTVFDDTAGGHVTCDYGPCATGRRPEGLAGTQADGPDEAARFLAGVAYFEAASVGAFERLTLELEAHGAPNHFSAASRRAARDEARHARVTKELAERAGATVPRVEVEPGEARSLEYMAIENAVEGCVRETFGAGVAMIQADRATDMNVRRAMKRIARDETRHAELSWAVARWLEPQLDAAARRRVREAQAKAVAALIRDAAREPDASLTELLGVPTASQARTLLAHLKATLWSEPMAPSL